MGVHMKISEIPINESVQIRVSQGDLKFECTAVVVAAKDDNLYLTPIKHEGQIIDFNSEKIQILVFYVSPERHVFGWSGCRIRKDIFQGKLCHHLDTKRDGIRVNRRSEPRIYTEMNAILRCPSDDKEKEIIVRNYSENGIGFTVKSNIPERDWPYSSLVYEDRQQQIRVVMRVHILRCTELPSGNYRCGARILQPDDEWIGYVQKKLEVLKERKNENPDVNTK
jgi:hypothetical protein